MRASQFYLRGLDMPEREAARQAAEFILSYRELLWILTLFILGAIAHTLISKEPFDLKRFTGELILASVAAVAMWAFGLMQGMSPIQMIFFGAMGGLGGVRLVEWGIKIAKAAREKSL